MGLREYVDKKFMFKYIPKRLSFQLGLSITIFICIIEIILLASSYISKKKDLYLLNEQIIMNVEKQTGKKISKALTDEEIESKLRQFAINVTSLVLIIIVSVVSGTLLIYRQIAGRHIVKLAKLEKETTLQNLALYPEDEIPENELGEVITARNKSLQQIQMSAARISILGDIAAGISHEINTPLNVIHGNSQLIRMDLESEEMDKEDMIKNLAVIERTVMKLGRIVKGISALSRDGEDQEVEAVKISEILNDVEAFGEDKVTKTGVTLEISHVDEDLFVECRPHQIFQAIMNMLNNSCDAIADLEEKWVKLDVKSEETKVQISITDSGAGIPAEIQDKIMKPYFTTKGVGKGTGLGLGFAKTIIEQHGGKIFIDSTKKNTCFVMELPKNSLSKLSA